jgi:membrane protease YdiL (CAAX protease family)
LRDAVRLTGGFVVVAVSMLPLFVFPKDQFAVATFIATAVMIAVAVANGGYRSLFKPSTKSVAIGLASAAALYLLFLIGNLAVVRLHPLGVGAQAEKAIYGLIASPGYPLLLQVAVLGFDAVGFESYFRGTLQKGITPRLGVLAPFAVAALDAAAHIPSFNLLWIVATFLADLVWGLTYYYTRDLTSSMTSHLVWDIAIFLLVPIG